MKLFSRRFAFVVAWLLGSFPLLAQAQEPYFPGLVFHPEDKELNGIVDEIKSAQLKALKEPSLWRKSQTDPKATTYRFLWLGSNEHPTCMRITRIGDVVTLHVSRHNMHPGSLTGEDHPKVTVDREVKLTLKEWDDIVGRLEAAKFWAVPTDILENAGIADGDSLIIEGIKDGKYHVIQRVREVTAKEFDPIFRTVVEAAGPDILNSYDRKPPIDPKQPK